MTIARRLVPALLIVVALVLIVGCTPSFRPDSTPTPSVGASAPASGEPAASPTPSPTPAASASPIPAAIPLAPAQPGADPLSTLAWIFTPLFWALLNVLVLFDTLTGNIAIAIILLTLTVRLVQVPVYRRQLVSQKRLQLVQPELNAYLKKFDRNERVMARREFLSARGINELSGCLPTVLSLFLLLPMFQVISQGLTNYDPSGMSLIPLQCDPAPIVATVNGHQVVLNPCLDPIAFGVNWSIPEVFAEVPIPVVGFVLGLSVLAILSGVLQFISSRMTLPSRRDGKIDDANTRTQRQMAYILPFISIVYGGLFPAGLFLYWIFSTLFSIGQQYLIIGLGGLFPIFGFDPQFARDHSPRFPVAVPAPKEPDPSKGKASTTTQSKPGSPKPRTDPAATIRQRGRTSRRGRRR